MATYFYAAHNPRGFANTWNISRFDSKAARNAFVASRDDARAVTRKEAADLYAMSDPSDGALFSKQEPFMGVSRFWNERPEGEAA